MSGKINTFCVLPGSGGRLELKVSDELAKWSADVYAYAQDEEVTKGKKWAGFKLVEGRSNRKYTDEEKVARQHGR